jgi:hypothetical protein
VQKKPLLTEEQGVVVLVLSVLGAAFFAFQWFAASQYGSGGWADSGSPVVHPMLSVPLTFGFGLAAIIGLIFAVDGQ